MFAFANDSHYSMCDGESEESMSTLLQTAKLTSIKDLSKH